MYPVPPAAEVYVPCAAFSASWACATCSGVKRMNNAAAPAITAHTAQPTRANR